MRMVTISQFLSERNLNLTPKKNDKIYKMALRASRAGLIERFKNKSSHYTYDERVLKAAMRCITNGDDTRLFLADIKKLDKSEPELTLELKVVDEPKTSPGFVTIKKFCEKYGISDKSEISRHASSLFLSGLIERESFRGKNLMAYRESDLAEIARNCAARRASGDLKRFNRGKKADEAPAEPTPGPAGYKPGIFVRIWRWFFGYRKEVGV